MKKYFYIIFFSLFYLLIGQNFGFTKTKITLKNEFGIPYPNAVIILSSSDTNYVVNIDNDGEGINTAIHSKTGSFSGYGFAIPSNMVF